MARVSISASLTQISWHGGLYLEHSRKKLASTQLSAGCGLHERPAADCMSLPIGPGCGLHYIFLSICICCNLLQGCWRVQCIVIISVCLSFRPHIFPSVFLSIFLSAAYLVDPPLSHFFIFSLYIFIRFHNAHFLFKFCKSMQIKKISPALENHTSISYESA